MARLWPWLRAFWMLFGDGLVVAVVANLLFKVNASPRKEACCAAFSGWVLTRYS